LIKRNEFLQTDRRKDKYRPKDIKKGKYLNLKLKEFMNFRRTKNGGFKNWRNE